MWQSINQTDLVGGVDNESGGGGVETGGGDGSETGSVTEEERKQRSTPGQMQVSPDVSDVTDESNNNLYGF